MGTRQIVAPFGSYKPFHHLNKLVRAIGLRKEGVSLVIGAIQGELSSGNQAGLWGSLLPAAWSLALALRARGLGTTWTTLHLTYEREVAELLGIPADVHQGVLLPVAYTKGTNFRPGPRVDLDSVLHLNGW